ncbi:hypothetical protein CHS0354_034739 [Potamilus streckersoni]|uniref:Uncharacterized protein n=1 Tax=Potamilus streckersoni TaxID=2493646 RepID=A0AAE0SIK4_9BIVA|nr:hypothetical protein CHS0354_034739 [Potamilus streckersoni]
MKKGTTSKRRGKSKTSKNFQRMSEKPECFTLLPVKSEPQTPTSECSGDHVPFNKDEKGRERSDVKHLPAEIFAHFTQTFDQQVLGQNSESTKKTNYQKDNNTAGCEISKKMDVDVNIPESTDSQEGINTKAIADTEGGEGEKSDGEVINNHPTAGNCLELAVYVLCTTEEFKKLSYQMLQGTKASHLLVYRESAFGLPGFPIHPVTVTLDTDGVCTQSVIYLPNKTTQLSVRGSFNVAKFREVLQVLSDEKYTFCAGLQRARVLYSVKTTLHFKWPEERHQSPKCPVWFKPNVKWNTRRRGMRQCIHCRYATQYHVRKKKMAAQAYDKAKAKRLYVKLLTNTPR